MRRVPWWALASASAAPVLLIGGWTVAAARQSGSFDPVRDTISALAAHGARDRWLMTTALAGLGVCHVVTALGLRPAAAPGRLVHAAGGVATVLVAVFPQPQDGSSPAHVAAAGAGFAALSIWPVLASRRGPSGPAPLRPAAAAAATAVLLGLLGWFGVELATAGSLIGASERVAAGSQAVYPLVVVVLSRRGRR